MYSKENGRHQAIRMPYRIREIIIDLFIINKHKSKQFLNRISRDIKVSRTHKIRMIHLEGHTLNIDVRLILFYREFSF